MNVIKHYQPRISALVEAVNHPEEGEDVRETALDMINDMLTDLEKFISGWEGGEDAPEMKDALTLVDLLLSVEETIYQL